MDARAQEAGFAKHTTKPRHADGEGGGDDGEDRRRDGLLCAAGARGTAGTKHESQHRRACHAQKAHRRRRAAPKTPHSRPPSKKNADASTKINGFPVFRRKPPQTEKKKPSPFLGDVVGEADGTLEHEHQQEPEVDDDDGDTRQMIFSDSWPCEFGEFGIPVELEGVDAKEIEDDNCSCPPEGARPERRNVAA